MQQETVELRPGIKKIPSQWGVIVQDIDENTVMVKWSTGGYTNERKENLIHLLATA